MNKLIFALACFATVAMGQQSVVGTTNNPVVFTPTAVGHAYVECATLNGPSGPLKDCHFVNGTTLDDFANYVADQQKFMRGQYAKMSERYLRCSGILKNVPASK